MWKSAKLCDDLEIRWDNLWLTDERFFFFFGKGTFWIFSIFFLWNDISISTLSFNLISIILSENKIVLLFRTNKKKIIKSITLQAISEISFHPWLYNAFFSTLSLTRLWNLSIVASEPEPKKKVYITANTLFYHAIFRIHQRVSFREKKKRGRKKKYVQRFCIVYFGGVFHIDILYIFCQGNGIFFFFFRFVARLV